MQRGGTEPIAARKALNDKEKRLHAVQDTVNRCFVIMQGRMECSAKRGENDKMCQSMFARELSCFGDLFCPSQSKAAKGCLYEYKSMERCAKEHTDLQGCLQPALSRLADHGDENSLQAQAETKCGKFAEERERCVSEYGPNSSQCRPQQQKLRYCMGELLCPKPLEAIRNCIRSKQPEECFEDVQTSFDECMVEFDLDYYKRLGVQIPDTDEQDGDQ